jgi:hypothetical protein
MTRPLDVGPAHHLQGIDEVAMGNNEALAPTATICPTAMTIASARGWAVFIVRMGPPRKIRSAAAAINRRRGAHG